MNRIVLVFIIAMHLLTGQSVAQKSPSHDEAALELLKIFDTEQMMKNAVTLMLDSMIKGNPAIGPYRDTMLEWAEKYVSYDAMLPDIVKIYTEQFTESELREVIAFYRTPTGQRVLTKLPEVMQKAANVGTALAMRHGGELERMVLERSKQLGNPPP